MTNQMRGSAALNQQEDAGAADYGLVRLVDRGSVGAGTRGHNG